MEVVGDADKERGRVESGRLHIKYSDTVCTALYVQLTLGDNNSKS